jgi:hypothetical protein
MKNLGSITGNGDISRNWKGEEMEKSCVIFAFLVERSAFLCPEFHVIPSFLPRR